MMRRQASLGFQLVDQYVRERDAKTSDEETLNALKRNGPMPGPLGPVDFHVVTGGTPNSKSDLKLHVTQNSSGVYVFTGLVSRTGGDTETRLPAGDYNVRISSRFYRTIETGVIRIPAADPRHALQTFDLVPNHAYPFPRGGSPRGGDRPTLLRGTLHEPGGAPLEGAIIHVEVTYPTSAATVPRDSEWKRSYLTEASGQWVFVVPDDLLAGNSPVARVAIRYPGSEREHTRQILLKPWATTLLSETGLRGRVQNVGGVSIPSAVVRVQGHPAHALSDDSGEWSYFFRFPDNTIGEVTVNATVNGRQKTHTLTPVIGQTTQVPDFIFD